MDGGIRVSESKGRLSVKKIVLIAISILTFVAVIGISVYVVRIRSTDTRSNAGNLEDKYHESITPTETVSTTPTPILTVTPAESKSTKLYERTCSYNTNKGEPVVDTCSPFKISNYLESDNLSEMNFGSFESYTFANGTKIRQSYLSANGETLYYRNCNFSERTGTSTCTEQYQAEDITNLRQTSKESYIGYSNLVFVQNGVYKIRQFFLAK